MSYELTLDQFENINLFSNRNMERVITEAVNASSNAALVNMGEDSVILLDHEEGQFYIADYSFNKDKLILEFTNFEEIVLVKESHNFEEDVRLMFEEDNFNTSFLAESYNRNVAEKDSFVNELISYALSKKEFVSDADYDELAEAVSSTNLKSTGKQFFREYVERLDTNPLTRISKFDWVSPVKVSLIESEKKKLVNKSVIQRAGDLWKKENFKKKFEVAASVFVENVEKGTELLKDLFESYPQVYYLDEADRNSMLGKAIIASDKGLKEVMKDIIKGINILFESGDLKEAKLQYLAENMADEGYENEGYEVEDEEDYDEDEDMDDYEEAPEVEPEDMEMLVADLEEIMDKCEDERTVSKLQDLIDKLSLGTEEGTRPDVVKEAVSILSM